MLISKVVEVFWRTLRYAGKTALVLFGGFTVILILASLVTPLPYVFGVDAAFKEVLNHIPTPVVYDLSLKVEGNSPNLIHCWLELNGETVSHNGYCSAESGDRMVACYKGIPSGTYKYHWNYLGSGRDSVTFELPELWQPKDTEGNPAAISRTLTLSPSGKGMAARVEYFDETKFRNTDTAYVWYESSGCSHQHVQFFKLFRSEKPGEMHIQSEERHETETVSSDSLLVYLNQLAVDPKHEMIVRKGDTLFATEIYSTTQRRISVMIGKEVFVSQGNHPLVEPFYAYLKDKMRCMEENVDGESNDLSSTPPRANDAFLKEYFGVQ